MQTLARLLTIDRRWIFLFIGLAVHVPFLTGLKFLQGTPTPATLAVFNYIDQLPPGSVVAIGFDYGPAGMPEMHPMAMAIIRQCFQRHLRVVALTIHPQGPLMAEAAFNRVRGDYKVKYGQDYVNLGFKPGGQAVILGIGSGIRNVYPTDMRGTPLSALPVMHGVRTYDDIAILIDLATGSTPGAWIAFGHQRFKVKMAIGITAVMATDFYVYYQTGQLVGILNGMRGAAEYENLVKHPDVGVLGMSSQSVAHLVIIVFVLLGNIGYFASRAHRRKQGGMA
ncbi:MAG: hypothetical protein ABFD94_18495 [Armatimonadia bacterium]